MSKPLNVVPKSNWALLKPGFDKCQECGTEHIPELPHNWQSLYYQMKFYQEHGRFPTWEDAMSHCDEDIKQRWTEEMAKFVKKVPHGKPKKTQP